MNTLVRIELSKIFRKWRTYIGFIAIAVLVAIIQLSIYLTGEQFVDFFIQNIKDTFEMVGRFVNGNLIALLVLQMLYVHIPFLIVLVGGDLLAGEATAGTYRMLLTRPISRFKLVASKFIAGTIYANLLLLFLMILSFGGSLLFFGGGELIVIKNKIFIFAADDVLWRFILAYGFATLSMTVVMTLSFFFSSLVENAIGPIVASMAVIIIFLILSSIDLELLRSIRPYLFVTHMAKWSEFFRDPIRLDEVLYSGLILLAHIVGLFGLTLAIFKRKDILS
jgi:ABC-2 type transport system permease protein